MAREQLGYGGSEGATVNDLVVAKEMSANAVRANWARISEIVGTRRTIIFGNTATRALSASESGSFCTFDRTAGCIYTLPFAEVGLQFDFAVITTVTSNTYKIVTFDGTDFLDGGILGVCDSNTPVGFHLDGTTHRAITSNGGTNGGKVGTNYSFVCLSANKWSVSGMNFSAPPPDNPITTS